MIKSEKSMTNNKTNTTKYHNNNKNSDYIRHKRLQQKEIKTIIIKLLKAVIYATVKTSNTIDSRKTTTSIIIHISSIYLLRNSLQLVIAGKFRREYQSI